jgi:23S rRNA (uracil1939-C5)-methyltransferase
MIRSGDVISLSIEKPAVGGRMIARDEGRVVLVGGAIPGERVRARIGGVSRGVVYADVVGVDAPSSDRRDWPADPACGGCVYGHIAYNRQLEIKSAVIGDAFTRIGRLPLATPVPVAASEEHGYRMRARLHVRGPAWGFFREGSHDLCDARATRQLLSPTCDAVDQLTAAAASLGLRSPYQIELAENVAASHRVALIDSHGGISRSVMDRLGAIDGLSGVAAPGELRGDPHVVDSLTVAGRRITLRRHVQAFFQGNRFLIERLVTHVTDNADSSGEVLDLYAGGGLFSTAIAAAHGVRVTAVEGDRTSAADLAHNASAVPGVTAVHSAVEDYLTRATAGQARTTVVVDPPRTGMSKAAVDAVLAVAPQRLIYVSCDVATLARDARRAIDGGYHLADIHGFDMFPNTPHVEIVAVFDR